VKLRVHRVRLSRNGVIANTPLKRNALLFANPRCRRDFPHPSLSKRVSSGLVAIRASTLAPTVPLTRCNLSAKHSATFALTCLAMAHARVGTDLSVAAGAGNSHPSQPEGRTKGRTDQPASLEIDLSVVLASRPSYFVTHSRRIPTTPPSFL